MSTAQKIVIITGGAAGIGLATTQRFLSSGSKVCVLDVRRGPELPPDSETLFFVDTNVTDEASVERAFATVVEKWGRVDVLVNNAGVMDKMSRTGDVTNDIWTRCLAINVTGPMYTSRLAIRHFLNQPLRGCIVNICSTASIRGAAAGAAYTASKHALLGLSRSTAWGYAKEGIRTNAVLPGGVETGIMGDINVDGEGRGVLMPFMGTMPGTCKPSDIAEAVFFLAGAEAVNGAEVTVDQGWTTS